MKVLRAARAAPAAAPLTTADATSTPVAPARALRLNRRALELLIRVVSLTLVLGAWQIFGGRVDPILFTTPAAIAVAAGGMLASGELWFYLWPSLVVLAVGLAFSIVIGVATGLLLARLRLLDLALDVYITFLYSIPTVALVPLIVLWVGFESTAKIVILFLFAFFPMVINTYQGSNTSIRTCSRSVALFAAPSVRCGPISCCPPHCRSS